MEAVLFVNLLGMSQLTISAANSDLVLDIYAAYRTGGYWDHSMCIHLLRWKTFQPLDLVTMQGDAG